MNARETEMWTKYKSSGSDADRNAIFEDNWAWIQERTLGVLRAKKHESLLEDALSCVAERVLAYAIPSFDPSRRNPFHAYLHSHIVGAVLDLLRSRDRSHTAASRSTARKVKDTRRWLAQEIGRRPSDAEVSEASELSEIDIILSETPGEVQGDWAENMAGERGQKCVVGPIAKAECRYQDVIEDIAGGLKGRSKTILAMYAFGGYTMKEIGERTGLSESRISQIIEDIRQFLKRKSDSRVQKHD